MPAKKKVTTSATKHKLPLPKGHPQVKAKPKKRKPTPTGISYKKCPRCEKMLRLDAKDESSGVHSCYNAKKLREPFTTPSPIAGHSLDGIGSAPIEVARAIPCGEDTTLGGTFPFVWVDCSGITLPPKTDTQAPSVPLPPDTSSSPWDWRIIGGGVAALTYVDDAIRATRLTLGLPTANQRVEMTIRAYWTLGWSDGQIGERIGMFQPSVGKIRRRMQLPAHFSHNRR